ncbi:MAG: hypothetical protein WBV82_19510 [Myxococcaceae bacterium]
MGLRKIMPVVLVALGLLPLLGAGALVIEKQRDKPVRTLKAGDLVLRFERSGWVHDEMTHVAGFKMPPSMMPDMPLPGQQRMTVEFAVFNAGQSPVAFSTGELVLASGGGTRWPSLAAFDTTELAPGHSLTTMVGFDVVDGDEPLTLSWERAGEKQRILATRSPPIAPLPALKSTEWPKQVSELPPGNVGRGSALYNGRLACFTCHGQPGVPGSNTVGPSMDGIGNEAAKRVGGLSAAQYLYESILDPNAAIAPQCAGNQPCVEPSTMPFYGELLSPAEMADLVAFLIQQSRG